MARPHSPHADPASDAAGLLRRLGFALLMLGVPLAALVTRRAVVILVPIGIILLVIAAILDGDHRELPRGLARLASLAGLAGAVALGWTALSLLWTPFQVPAVERFLNILATVILAVAGYLSLPERMRSANLYLVTVGTGVAGLAAVGLALWGSAGAGGLEGDGLGLERGLVVLAMMIWPAIAWLRSRNRDVEALALGLVAAIAAVLGSPGMAFAALAIGLAAFVLTAAAPRSGPLAVGGIMAGLLVFAPLLPFAAEPVATALLGPRDPQVASLAAWRGVVADEPVRLITGHGFETALRGRVVGLLPPASPSTLLFEVWYELGIVGALAGAVALFRSARGAAAGHPALVPGIMGAFATAFALACLGIGTAQMWWFTTLAAIVLIFVAAERGQFRTKRPKALLAGLRPSSR